jgi:hypothetical protein
MEVQTFNATSRDLTLTSVGLHAAPVVARQPNTPHPVAKSACCAEMADNGSCRRFAVWCPVPRKTSHLLARSEERGSLAIEMLEKRWGSAIALLLDQTRPCRQLLSPKQSHKSPARATERRHRLSSLTDGCQRERERERGVGFWFDRSKRSHDCARFRDTTGQREVAWA